MKVVGFFSISSSCALKPSPKLGRIRIMPGGLINKSYFRDPCTHAWFEKYCASGIKRYPESLFVFKPKGITIHFGFAIVGEENSLR